MLTEKTQTFLCESDHSVRDKGAGIFLRKCHINLCFLSGSLSEKSCHSFYFLSNFHFSQNAAKGERSQSMWLGRETKSFIGPTDRNYFQHEPSECPLKKELL